MREYAEFLMSKRVAARACGFDANLPGSKLFEFQDGIVRWATRKGRAAVFADCGLGKTAMQLYWARLCAKHTKRNALILAPLAVSTQTVREGEKFGIGVTACRSQSDVKAGINITNYEMLEHFNPRDFSTLVLDESSILKGDGPMRKAVEDFGSQIDFRLACTATPAPNDHMELGNHAEFLGVMSKSEMLSMFFIHDGGETAKWRLKGHAQKAFWEWVASWAVMMRKPSDLGYSDEGFDLPPIQYHQHTVQAPWSGDELFPVEAKGLMERRGARRDSIAERVALCADLVNTSKDSWIVWCDLNDESKALAAAIPGSVEVTGSDKSADKESRLLGFADGKHRVLVSKSSIAGFGMNFQRCSHMAFVGLSDSWEQVYQATRRCWRFGQQKPVNVHFITGELEGAVVRNIKRKEEQAAEMAAAMVEHMRGINSQEIHGATQRQTEAYIAPVKMEVPAWLA